MTRWTENERKRDNFVVQKLEKENQQTGKSLGTEKSL
jgi:hypothetical protein